MEAMKRVLAAALILGGLAAAGAAQAQSTTGSLTVNASVADNCTVSSPTLDFGSTVNVLGGNTDASATINVTCTVGTAFFLGLGDGLNYVNPNRRMRIGATASYLNYELYRESGRTSRFGDTDDTNDRVGETGQGSSADAIVVYGRIPSGQTTATVGSYTDTVGITVRW